MMAETHPQLQNSKMNIYLAPMEGITGYIVRGAFHRHFGCIDKYFTPFIPAAKRLSRKIIRDIEPSHNEGIRLVPQLISNDSREVLNMISQLKDYGYREFNINLGCPSGTVVSKRRGSGLLFYPDELDRFLDGIYRQADVPVSVKTRIGFQDLAEWPHLLEIFARYPMSEFIIHPRLRRELYTGLPHWEAFRLAYSTFINNHSAEKKHRSPEVVDILENPALISYAFTASITDPSGCVPSPLCYAASDTGSTVSANASPLLCYNGDIWTTTDYLRIAEAFPEVQTVMIGRGLLARPDLACAIKGVSVPDARGHIRSFCEEIYEGYREVFSSEKDVCMHMKEIWANLGRSFEGSEKLLKKLMKCQTPGEYHTITRQIWETLPLAPR